jgi:UDP-2,3-diacylglucosamine pyrophosphatase LpxH
MTTVIVSDLHLGCRFCLHAEFLRFLDALPAEATLVLNGDTVDRRHTPFPEPHRLVLERLRAESRRRRVVWVRGNHDDRYVLDRPEQIEMAAAHALQPFLYVSHGHDFYTRTVYYRLFVWAFKTLHDIRLCLGAPSVHVALFAKKLPWLYRLLKRQVALNAAEYARENGYRAVACGHVHDVEDFTVGGVRYVNTGAWTERPLACLVVQDGALELRRLPPPV